MSDQSAVNLLLVDDRPENLLALEAILEPLGQNLVRALSGEEALRRILTMDFAVILLDVQMPGMNGFETAQMIKARERSSAIPIIFLTAISKEEAYVFKGYSVGAVDYMFKPFQPDILRSKVAVFVDLFRKQEQIKEQEQALREGQRRELELRHQAKLFESEARTAEIVDSAMDAIMTIDDQKRITLYNAAAERMFGYPAEEAIGRSIAELIPQSANDDFLDGLCGPTDSASSSSGALPDVPLLTGVRSSGEVFPLEMSVSCLELAERKTYTVIARDVTERARAQEALRQHAAWLAKTSEELKAANAELNTRQRQLEEAMKARNRFYASMSHELRTPINAIIGYNTLLLDNIYGPLNERQTHGIERTHKAAKHLLELVNDILDLSKIEAGKIELSLQPVSFPALIEDLFVTVRPLSDEHGSTLALAGDGAPMSVVSDPRRVRQILLNLLSNAIKFGKGNPIVVRYAGRDGGGVAVEVEDRGIGISERDLPRIFDEFVQVEHAQESGGTGLGLPISQRLAHLLGGTLEVESQKDVGSVFRLVLPASADISRTVRTPTPAELTAVTPAPAFQEMKAASESASTGASTGASPAASPGVTAPVPDPARR